MTRRSPRPTVDQLRNAIDHGDTGDKVDALDPAAAPLGTDEEAAGTPVPPAAVADALRHEASRPSVAKAQSVRIAVLVGVVTAAAIVLIATATLFAL